MKEVEERFRNNFSTGRDSGSGMCVFEGEKKLISLYGGFLDAERLTPTPHHKIQLAQHVEVDPRALAELLGALARAVEVFDEVEIERLLREAVLRDDTLRYDEPWGWIQPVRHALGALTLEQGRVEQAEQAYHRTL